MSISEFTITRPDDWHLHLRDGAMLKAVIGHSSANFSRAIIMPNLMPPIVTTAQAADYKKRILAVLPKGDHFQPLMTLYLTQTTDLEDLAYGVDEGVISAVKLYPAGATTNSQSGVRNIEDVYPILERMAEIGVPLLMHGEVTDDDIDIFDREAVFIERVLQPMRRRFPELRIVLEHVTTSEGVNYVANSDEGIAATITVHHLIINRNAYLAGGIKPHYYCLPVAKREQHRLALRAAATSGNNRFFLGTDSAPHVNHAKEQACGCAGIFTSINSLNCLAQVFEDEKALSRLEGFASLHGPAFYRLPVNEDKVRFTKQSDPIEFLETIRVDEDLLTVFDAGFPLFWSHKRVNDKRA